MTASVKLCHILKYYDINQKLDFISAFLTERHATSELVCKCVKVIKPLPRSGAPHQRPNMVPNGHEFPHHNERVRKKLAHEHRIRLASWNIDFLIGILES